MPIPRTAIDDELPGYSKLLERQRIVRNVQNDISRNAARHKEMLAAGAPLERVQQFAADCAANYAYWLDAAESAGTDADIQSAMAAVGWSEKDFADKVAALRTEVSLLASAPKANRAQIEAACDTVIARVDKPVIAVGTLFAPAIAVAAEEIV